MKYTEITSLFDGAPAHLALLSTFQFDPDFFERRLLRCDELARARRIAVFMDSREWLKLLRRESPARWLNRRYLVVPVTRTRGVFHPKLTLLATEAGCKVLCGSNNLTRSGCSSNLELLNTVSWSRESSIDGHLDVARTALAFFEQAAANAESGVARIVNEWLADLVATVPSLKTPVSRSNGATVRLVHSYGGTLWNELVQQFTRDRVTEFFIVSPYHDKDAGLCRRLIAEAPAAKIELLVQSHVTRLAVQPIKKLKAVRLAELSSACRRVHAKLIAWRGDHGSGCLVGSANFTSAALDGRNVEACLIVDDSDRLVSELFDGRLSKKSVAFDKFQPGMDALEQEESDDAPDLLIRSAVLGVSRDLLLSYTHRLQDLISLRLAIRLPGERLPRVNIPVVGTAAVVEKLKLPEQAFADSHGSLLATLVAERKTGSIESAPVWVVQEERLTYEPSGGPSSSRRNIEETGEGLPEYLDELGARDGISAVIDYLRHLNIRFNDGTGGRIGGRAFRVKMRDPFQADNAPVSSDRIF